MQPNNPNNAQMMQAILAGILNAQQAGMESIATTMANAQTTALDRMSQLQEQNHQQINTLVGAITGAVTAGQFGDLLR